MNALPVCNGHRKKSVFCLLGVLMFGWQIAPVAPVRAAGKAAFVTASLTDRRGLFIQDLAKDEVQIMEDNKPRKIEFMAQEEVPTVYGLIFDYSMLPENPENDYRGSRLVISSATAARSLAHDLIDKHLGRQTIWVGGYAKELSITQDFTSDGFSAKSAIQAMHSGRGVVEPFLYSALVAGVMKMNTRSEKRRVIILFLDALDSDTAGKIKPLKNLLSSSNVELFVVSFASKLGSGRGGLAPAISRSSLQSLTETTCGEAFFGTDYGDHLEDLARRLYNELSTLYTFGFESEGSAGKPSRLTILCTRPGAKVRHHPTVVVLP